MFTARGAFARFLAVALLALAALTAPMQSRADAIEDFYKGKQITLIVGSPAGGIYDIYARTLARHLPKHVPGNPQVVVQYMPGSGAIAAVNHVYNVAPKDGTVIVAPSNTTAFLPLLGTEAAKFDPKKILWLGSPTQETGVFFVWHKSKSMTFADTQKEQVIVGSNGPQGHSGILAKVLNDILKTKLKSIDGYAGPAEAILAMERGEIDGRAGIFYNQLKASYTDQLKDGRFRVLLHYGAKPHPELSQIPYGPALIKDQADAQIFGAAQAPLSVGYPLLMGPDIPAERQAAMRKAVADTYKDKEFLAEADKQKIDVAPISGEGLDKIIRDTYALPPDVVARFRKLYDAAE
jgi:tripartite-type tricarboxylate transporter receptor subunit TctC